MAYPLAHSALCFVGYLRLCSVLFTFALVVSLYWDLTSSCSSDLCIELSFWRCLSGSPLLLGGSWRFVCVAFIRSTSHRFTLPSSASWASTFLFKRLCLPSVQFGTCCGTGHVCFHFVPLRCIIPCLGALSSFFHLIYGFASSVHVLLCPCFYILLLWCSIHRVIVVSDVFLLLALEVIIMACVPLAHCLPTVPLFWSVALLPSLHLVYVLWVCFAFYFQALLCVVWLHFFLFPFALPFFSLLPFVFVR